jgi:hypothetical protein
MEEKLKAALANVDKVISSVSMNRQEHLVLVQNIELLKEVSKEYLVLTLANKKEESKDE